MGKDGRRETGRGNEGGGRRGGATHRAEVEEVQTACNCIGTQCCLSIFRCKYTQFQLCTSFDPEGCVSEGCGLTWADDVTVQAMPPHSRCLSWRV